MQITVMLDKCSGCGNTIVNSHRGTRISYNLKDHDGRFDVDGPFCNKCTVDQIAGERSHRERQTSEAVATKIYERDMLESDITKAKEIGYVDYQDKWRATCLQFELHRRNGMSPSVIQLQSGGWRVCWP